MARQLFWSVELARAFLAGAWSLDGLLQSGKRARAGRGHSVRFLVKQVLTFFPDANVLPGEEELADFLEQNRIGHRRMICTPPSMTPAPWISHDAGLPILTTTVALTEWLGLSRRELDWFADTPGRRRKRHDGILNHYTYRFLNKASGKKRVLEIPRSRLKAIQRRILGEILDRLPPHESATAYRRGKSALDHAALHAGKVFVLALDLKDFFPSIRASRVHAVFRGAGYPRPVARVLTRLCTTIVPWSVEEEHRRSGVDWMPFRNPHLPQGAPTSPALANLCAYRFDCRLSGLARAVGAAYSRYADDLAFSGGEKLERSARRFQVMVCRLALEEGFEVNTRKTRFMRRGLRQQLTGLIVNDRPNIRRAEFDLLEAILFNCVRHGPEGQNREGVADFRAHLQGRVAHVKRVNPQRGQRLQELFTRIHWV
jgi:hypothetical protein